MTPQILIWTLGLWFIYRIVMYLKKKRERLKSNKPLYYLAYLFVIVGVILDVIYNVIVGSIIFLDPPHEFLFTSRLKRYRRGSYTWRWRLATFFCQRLLNPYDPKGEHC